MLRAVALLVAALLALTACTGGDEEPAADPTPTAEPTPLADFATDSLTVARESFCARVAPAAVADALGGEPERADAWANGDRAAVGGVTDVVHEFGCRWRAADGRTVSGWVFAPPVTSGRAATLRKAAARTEGCRPVTGAPAYGSPSVALRCEDGTISFHGLFGDAWLACSAPTADLAAAGRWCVSIAQAATA